MKPYDSRKPLVGRGYQYGRNNCLQVAVAKVMRLDWDYVPHFTGLPGSWTDHIAAWGWLMGYVVEQRVTQKAPRWHGKWIGCHFMNKGKTGHAVIYQGGALWDMNDVEADQLEGLYHALRFRPAGVR